MHPTTERLLQRVQDWAFSRVRRVRQAYRMRKYREEDARAVERMDGEGPTAATQKRPTSNSSRDQSWPPPNP